VTLFSKRKGKIGGGIEKRQEEEGRSRQARRILKDAGKFGYLYNTKRGARSLTGGNKYMMESDSNAQGVKEKELPIAKMIRNRMAEICNTKNGKKGAWGEKTHPHVTM